MRIDADADIRREQRQAVEDKLDGFHFIDAIAAPSVVGAAINGCNSSRLEWLCSDRRERAPVSQPLPWSLRCQRADMRKSQGRFPLPNSTFRRPLRQIRACGEDSELEKENIQARYGSLVSKQRQREKKIGQREFADCSFVAAGRSKLSPLP